MAASKRVDSASRLSSYNAFETSTTVPLPLPNGTCNFRDLSGGSSALRCGCTRFWLNSYHSQGGGSNFEKAWCFCGHHACFHEDAAALRPGSGDTVQSGQSERMNNNTHDKPIPASWPTRQEPAPVRRLTGLGIQSGPSRPPSPPSHGSAVWEVLNAFARDQEIAQKPYTGPSLPSTAPASIVEERRRSPLSVIREHHRKLMAPPINVHVPAPEPYVAAREEYSATEVATPSIAGTPDMGGGYVNTSQTGSSPSNIRPATLWPSATRLNTAAPKVPSPATTVQGWTPNLAPVKERTPSIRRSQGPGNAVSLHDMQNFVRTLSQRIEVLENMSFSHVPVEAVQDKFESFEGRILDLEHWRTDREEAQALEESANEEKAIEASRRLVEEKESGSFSSDGSFDSHAAAYTEAAILATLAANSETAPCLAALEDRIAELESTALPSFSHPWKVEVVVLPWGRDLRGIWFSSTESTQHSLGTSTQLSDEWTPIQPTPRLSFKSTSTAAWTTESIQAWAVETQEWLSPKACGPAGIVYQRLASRGLVQEITLTSPDAHHILGAMQGAFTGVLDFSDISENPLTDRFAALAESLVPLRKVRKSSRLRFLSPAEMVTPAVWTAAFIDASICMKINDGPRRVYVTTPDAYLQPSHGRDEWSWPRIRQLPLFNASGHERTVQAHGLAIEACWSYNDRIDRPLSIQSAASTPSSQWTSSDAHSPQPPEQATQTPTTIIPIPVKPLQKRRVVSADSGIAVLSNSSSNLEPLFVKRRRLSDPPEAERRGAGFTPRLSREPPSPFTSEAAIDLRSQGAGSRKRGNTPFAYATPHSHNNQYPERMDFKLHDGDTEPDTDFFGPQSLRGDEEWQGVDDEIGSAQLDGDESLDEPDDDDDSNDDDEDGEEDDDERSIRSHDVSHF